jgi:pimeloyl-ACP methyl ester carboxylesterase
LLVAPLVLPDLEKIAPVEAIAGVPADVPVLILAGGEDRSARPEEARAIFERVRSHGRFVLFENGGHMNFLDLEPERYRQVLLSFARTFTLRPG